MSTGENKSQLFHCQISGGQAGTTAVIFLGGLRNIVIIQQWGTMNVLMVRLVGLNLRYLEQTP